MARLRHRERGVVLVWVVLMLLVMIGLIGLATDTARVYYAGQQLQHAADGAALAGAQLVRGDPALVRELAMQIASENEAERQAVQLADNVDNLPEGDIVIGRFEREDGTFTPTLTSPNAVRVLGRRAAGSPNGPQPLTFGPIFGVDSINIERSAIAMIGGGTGAGVIALNPGEKDKALEVRGNAILQVSGGDVQVNSTHRRGALVQGNAVIDAPNLNVVGGAAETGHGEVTGSVNEGAASINDPLAFLPDLDYAGWPDHGTIDRGGTFAPGYYSGGIDLNAAAAATLESGVYVLDGAGFYMVGDSSLTSLPGGVMFYIVGSGYVDLAATVSVSLSAIENGVYEGVTIFQARGNAHTSTLLGTSNLDLEGTLYFPDAHLQLGGTGDGFGTQLIANTIEVFGDGVKTVNYDGRFPAVGNRVFLVR